VKRSTTRVLAMDDLRARGQVTEVIGHVAADLVAKLARDAWLANESFAHWPVANVDYLSEAGFGDDGLVRLESAPPAVAQFLRIHATVETR
jgi:hypothetical protein